MRPSIKVASLTLLLALAAPAVAHADDPIGNLLGGPGNLLADQAGNLLGESTGQAVGQSWDNVTRTPWFVVETARKTVWPD